MHSEQALDHIWGKRKRRVQKSQVFEETVYAILLKAESALDDENSVSVWLRMVAGMYILYSIFRIFSHRDRGDARLSLSHTESTADMMELRVRLHSLPTELKQQILRYCRDQDIYLSCALDQVSFDQDAATNTNRRQISTLEDVARQNRSLTALASVSREWNEVAASVAFEVCPCLSLAFCRFFPC